MRKIYKLTEFKSAAGHYNCICEDLIGKHIDHYAIPAQLLQISVVDMIKLLITYNAIIEKYINSDGTLRFICWHWDNLQDARTWKNMINSKARKNNFYIEF